jgi:hypothetical protein
VICWHLLTNDCDYDDLGGDYFTRRNTDRQRDRLIKQLHTAWATASPGQDRVGQLRSILFTASGSRGDGVSLQVEARTYK